MSLTIELPAAFTVACLPNGSIDRLPDIALVPGEPSVFLDQCSITCNRWDEEESSEESVDDASLAIMTSYQDVVHTVPLSQRMVITRREESLRLPATVVGGVFQLHVEAVFRVPGKDEPDTAVAHCRLLLAAAFLSTSPGSTPATLKASSAASGLSPDAVSSPTPRTSWLDTKRSEAPDSAMRLKICGLFLDENVPLDIEGSSSLNAADLTWNFQLPRSISEENRKLLQEALTQAWRPNHDENARSGKLGSLTLNLSNDLKLELMSAMRLPIKIQGKSGNNTSDWHSLSLRFKQPLHRMESMRRQLIQFLIRDCRRLPPDPRAIDQFLSRCEEADLSSDGARQRWLRTNAELRESICSRQRLLERCRDAAVSIREIVADPVDKLLSNRWLWLFRRNSAVLRLNDSVVADLRGRLLVAEMREEIEEVASVSKRIDDQTRRFEEGFAHFLEILKQFPWADALQEFAEESRIYWHTLKRSFERWRQNYVKHLTAICYSLQWITDNLLPRNGGKLRIDRKLRAEFAARQAGNSESYHWLRTDLFSDFERVTATFALRSYPSPPANDSVGSSSP